MTSPHTFVSLRRDSVSVLLDATGGRLPALLHWGADLGPLHLDDARALGLAAQPPVAPNLPDVPPRLAILPEGHTGWTGRPGLQGSRAGRDWSPQFTVSSLTLDGVPLAADTGIAEGHAVVVRAADRAAGLELTLAIELAPGGLLRSRATLANAGTAPYQLDSLTLAYPVPDRAATLLDFAGRWANERVPQRRDFTVGTHLREGRRGRTGADAATVLHAGVPGFGFAAGDVWGVHVGWSGNHIHYAEQVSTGERVLGGGELLLPGEIVLAPGEDYTSPWLYGSYGAGLDAVARRFHRFLRARPQHPDAQRPVTLNVWETVYFDHALEPLRDLADLASAAGVERFVLDDGWFSSRRDDTSGLGDWVVADAVWPDGLGPLVEHVTGLGMQFGLWFEPEMVNLDSDVARAHPEWVMATGGRLPVPSRHQQVLNLGIPECYAHVRDAMDALLSAYPISYLKWDHNRDLSDAGGPPGGRPGVHAQTLAAYRLMAELKRRHPGLEIESCSSGGARVDLGVAEHTDRVWVSDNIDPLDRQQMLRWTTQLLPPEMLGSHIASGRSHVTERSHDLTFRAATALFGHLGVEWDLRAASATERAELAEWIAFYRAQRAWLLRGDLVRVDEPDPSLVVGGIVAADRTRALFSYAQVATPTLSLGARFRLPGLDAERRYRIRPILTGWDRRRFSPPPWWAEGLTLTGAALGTLGVIPPVMPPENAVLHLVEALD